MQHSKKLLRVLLATTTLSALLLTGAVAASIGTAVVEGDTLYLRREASTQSDIITSAVKGDQVEVTGEAVDGWYPVLYGEFAGYMSGEYLRVTLNTSTSPEKAIPAAPTEDTALAEDDDTVADSSSMVYGRVTASTLNLRASASTDAEKIGSAPYGALVEIWDTTADGGWYKIVYNGITAYASTDYVLYDVDPFEVFETTGDKIVTLAAQYLGCRYSYGSSGPSSFDCSGFTSYIYKQFGITLNRSASGQTQNGTYVSRSELQAGDLVLFRHSGSSKAATHVGIYVGGGQFIHASTNDYQVRYDNLDSAYYSGIFIGGRHVVD